MRGLFDLFRIRKKICNTICRKESSVFVGLGLYIERMRWRQEDVKWAPDEKKMKIACWATPHVNFTWLGTIFVVDGW